MLYEIVGKLNFHQEVNLDQVFFLRRLKTAGADRASAMI